MVAALSVTERRMHSHWGDSGKRAVLFPNAPNAVWAGPVSDTPLVLGSAYQPLPRERLSRMPAPDLEF
jgi:hypothetical protein